MEEIYEQLDEKEYLEYVEKWKIENRDLIESNNCKKCFIECLPKWEYGEGSGKMGTINWSKTINYKVEFIYQDIIGFIEIIGFIKEKHPKLIIIYNNKEFIISSNNLKTCGIGRILNLITKEFKIEIGTRFQDDKRDITITDREYRKEKHGKAIANQKYYKYTCNVCGWTEGWITEEHLFKGIGCSCCYGRTVVEGINDIPTTAPWLTKFFQGGYDEAKLYTKASNQKIQPICPDCGQVKDKPMMICTIYRNHSISCMCSDNISFGEKIIFSVLEQLKINFKTQLNNSNLKWCKKYKYDFYFEYNNEQYICEVNGNQHYEDAWDKLEKTQLNDKNKKELALENGIKPENYIIIDCRKSELEWIRDNEHGILNSRFSELFDLNKIDWQICHKYTCSNLVKIACEYKRNNPEIATIQIANNMNMCRNVILKYLKLGTKLGWCIYNSKDEMKKSGSKQGFSSGIPLICKSNGIIFNSLADCERKSEELFGVKLLNGELSAVCLGKKPQYKGYKFEYIKDLTPKEYIKYDIENKLKELNF